MILTKPDKRTTKKISNLTMETIRLLDFMDNLKTTGVVKYKSEIFELLGISRQTIDQIKNGEQSFRIEHIAKLKDHYNLNPNFIFGIEKNWYYKSL